MSNICLRTGWSEEYAYERDMNLINDIIYQNFEYYSEGPQDLVKDFENKRWILRGKK